MPSQAYLGHLGTSQRQGFAYQQPLALAPRLAMRWGPALFLPFLSACSAAPSIYIAGSYFPAWLLSALVGIVLTVLIRVVLIRIGVDDALPLRLLVYVCMTLALTFATLLLFFE